MTSERHNDLVPPLAIVVGAVVSVVVTFLAFYGGGDEATTVAPIEVVEEWTDPRGPDRGPTPLEWEVIAAYKPIERMTASEPAPAVVDASLEELRLFAAANRDNPYIQELYLKGLRVAHYYTNEAGDAERATGLLHQFALAAARVQHLDGVEGEVEAMRAQLERQRSGG